MPQGNKRATAGLPSCHLYLAKTKERVMALKTMEDLFIHGLKDIYYAEKKLVQNLPKMAKKAESRELAQAIERHLRETQNQVTRLERVFKLCEMEPRGKKCPGIEGLLEEAKEIMEDAEEPNTLDAGMLAAAQSVEHYEICKYGTLVAWAEELGMTDAASLLEETLAEEKNADRLLSQLAEGKLNREAA
jgi:ferritin-like metal-binding protein YciE